jgi:pimeloyl-ACP methyl ester carboxylesterase
MLIGQALQGGATLVDPDEERPMDLSEGRRGGADDGRPLVLMLPGLLCDDAVWTQQCAALPGHRCVVPDYGANDSIAGMAQQVLTEAPAEHFSLIGHSMGGRVALEIMRLAPKRVQRLALLDTGIDAIAPGAAGDTERAGRMALLDKARSEGMGAMGRQWARGMVHPGVLATPLFEQIIAMIERKTPAIFEAQIHALLGRPDARAVLQGVACDTLLLCGRQDVWSPLARHEQMLALRPASRLVVVEDCGHMSTMEQPQAVSAALRSWLGLAAEHRHG